MSELDPQRGPDSFMRGAVTVANSSKGRAIGSWLVRWVLLPTITLVGGWLTHAWQLGDRLDRRMDAIDAVIGADKRDRKSKDDGEGEDPESLVETLQRIDRNVLELRSREQQHLLQIGRQAAYATTCCETGEARKLLDAKRKEARSDAARYENAVLRGKDPEVAYTLIARP